MITFMMKRHDTRPFLDTNLRVSSTEYVDLNIENIQVTFIMKDIDTNEVKINGKECIIIDPDTGSVRYAWDLEDTDTAGIYQGEFEVIFPSEGDLVQAKTTYPVDDSFVIVVMEDFNNA